MGLGDILSTETLIKIIYSGNNVKLIVLNIPKSKKEKIHIKIIKYIINFINKIKNVKKSNHSINLPKIAHKHNIELYITDDVNSEKLKIRLQKIKPDLICIAGIYQILKDHIINIPKNGVINFHPSELPKYRGSSPFFWIFKNDERYTAATIHYVDSGVDTGDIILQKRYFIQDGITGEELAKEVAKIGSILMVDAINQIKDGSVQLIKQQSLKKGFRIYSPRPEDGKICIEKSVKSIYNFINGVACWVEPYFEYRGKKIPIKKALSYQITTHDKFGYLQKKDRLLTFYGKNGVVVLQMQDIKKIFIKAILRNSI